MGEQRVARDVTVRFAEHGSSKELGARETFDTVNQEEQEAKKEEEDKKKKNKRQRNDTAREGARGTDFNNRKWCRLGRRGKTYGDGQGVERGIDLTKRCKGMVGTISRGVFLRGRETACHKLVDLDAFEEVVELEFAFGSFAITCLLEHTQFSSCNFRSAGLQRK